MAFDDYAVVVGITRYPGLSNLAGPENDAQGFCTWLQHARGGSVPPENISLIVSSQFPPEIEPDPFKARPTTEQVDAAFDRLVEMGVAKGGRLGRRLYIYLAGHGFGPDLEDVAVLMANAGKLRTGYHIPGRRYANWFRMAAMFEQIVLFMDCCRDDYRRAPVHLPPWTEIRSTAAANVLYFYGFATRFSHKARERALVQDGPVTGVFTSALLAALENSLPDDQGRITAEAITNYVYNYLPKLMEVNEYQDPEFDYDKRLGFVFSEHATPSLTRVRITFLAPDQGRGAEILDNDFKTVASLEAMAPQWELDLKPGRYLIRILGTDIRKTIDVLGTEVIDETL